MSSKPNQHVPRPGNSLWGFLTFLVAISFAGYFQVQATYNPSQDYYPYAWHVHWIKAPVPGKVACFRKTIYLTESPSHAYIAVAVNNFFEIEVNGSAIKPFFSPGRFVTWMADQSPYTEIGYPRKRDTGWIYDLGGVLHPGRNVLTLKVNADEGAPEIAVQGEVDGVESVRLDSDSSWKCAPRPTKKQDVTWNQPEFHDYDWPSAVETEKPVSVSVDGDPTVLQLQPKGIFIRSSQDVPGEVTFERKIQVPTGLQDGWLRMSCSSPFDLSLNGRLLFSNSMINRYDGFPWAKRGENSAFGAGQAPGSQDPATQTDAYARVEGTNRLNSEYPSDNVSRSVQIFLLKNIFREGENDIRIVLHDSPIRELRGTKMFWLDGSMESGSKSVTFGSDLHWKVTHQSLRNSGQAVSDSAMTRSFMKRAHLHFPGKLDPGLGFSSRIVLVCAILALIGCALEVILVRWGSSKSAFWCGVPWFPPALVLSTAYGLQLIFASSNQNELFESSRFAIWSLIVAVLGMGMAALARSVDRKRGARGTISREGGETGWWTGDRVALLALLAILVFGGTFYVRGLASSQLLTDEYVSILASRGIVRHGFPIYDLTGITYTRSSLYQYLLAIVIAVTNSRDFFALKLFSGFWQLATVVLVFFWGRQMKGNWAAVLAAALVAFSPFMVFFAREIRFYTQFAFFITLTFYLFWWALRCPQKEAFRVGAMLAFAGAYLSHQFALAATPGLLIMALYSGQMRLWFRGWSLVSFLFAVFAMGADALAYFRYCQTTLPNVDVESVSLLAFHVDGLEMLPSMLLDGYERTQFVVGSTYILGGLYWTASLVKSSALKAKATVTDWPWWSYLYLASCSSIILTTLLASRPTPRYIVQLYPLVCLTSACCLVGAANYVWQKAYMSGGQISANLARVGFGIATLLLLFASYRPTRTWNSTARDSERDLSAAMAYVKDHAVSTDTLVIQNAEAAMIEFDRCDYMWRPRRGSVFKYVGKDGVTRERNSAAVAIENADVLRRVMAKSNRIWIVAQSSNLYEQGGDPGGSIAKLVMSNFQVASESLGMTVMVWDKSMGHFRNKVPDHGYANVGF